MTRDDEIASLVRRRALEASAVRALADARACADPDEAAEIARDGLAAAAAALRLRETPDVA